MACDIMECCQFFKDHMQDLPKSAAYIQDKLCRADFEKCNRFRVYKLFGKENVPPDLDPDDVGEVEKVLRCLQEKQQAAAMEPQ